MLVITSLFLGFALFHENKNRLNINGESRPTTLEE